MEPRAVTESLSEVRDNVSWSQEIQEMGIKNQLSIYPTGADPEEAAGMSKGSVTAVMS